MSAASDLYENAFRARNILMHALAYLKYLDDIGVSYGDTADISVDILKYALTVVTAEMSLVDCLYGIRGFDSQEPAS